MNKYAVLIVLWMVCLIPFYVFGQEVAPVTDAEWKAFFMSIGGLKGAGAMAIAAVVAQGLFLALRTKLGEYAGKFRFLAISFLTLVTGIVALKMTGLDWSSVLMHSTTLVAFQVFLNNAYKQLLTPKGDQVPLSK